MSFPSDDFYCNQKFNWLSVDLEKRLTYSCCAAVPAKIDVLWLNKNPGKLFNTPQLIHERQLMLNNIPVASCKTACWDPEQQGLVSRRALWKSKIKTHSNLESHPTTLNIILGSNCNLTCSYCDKQYSTSWLQDINNVGPYLDIPKFKLTPVDQLILNISQKEHQDSPGFNTLINEIESFDNIDQIIITGGEPFLFNNLPSLLNKLHTAAKIRVYTGLGVNTTRLKTQLDKINKVENLTIVVSAENIGKFYEFNRYGNSYDNFCKNLNLLREYKVNLKFSAVVSNLTIFGLVDFVEQYGDENIIYQLCNDPTYLKVNVLDLTSVDKLIPAIKSSNILIKDAIIQNLKISSTKEQQQHCSIFLKEFARRRNLNLDIFPHSMLQWLNL